MKTQIANLRSGQKNQMLNSKVDYSNLPQATSHFGHSGNSTEEKNQVWEKVEAENSEKMTIILGGETIVLNANWSLSRKSVHYFAPVPNAIIANYGIVATKKEKSYIVVSRNEIKVCNGKNSFAKICPSLITIL